MTESLRALAGERLARGLPTVIVEVVATRGSVPREAGTRMLVWDVGTEATIGGGRLEWQAVALARAALDDPSRLPPDQDIALGASLGQCCGGAVTLRYRLLDTHALNTWPRQPPPLVQVYGAGHVGRAVVRVLETLDLTVQWIDERAAAFPTEASGTAIERLCVEPVEAEVSLASPGAFYLVVTHQHDLDLRIVEAILRRGDFGFVGLIGSMTKRRRFEQRLLRRGIAPLAISRLTCPIGIAGISGKEPSVIAVSVVAQLLQAMRPEDDGAGKM